jgi:DNA-binding NtrC family response regulator
MECDVAYLRESHTAEILPPGTYVYVEVDDTGCGMDAEIACVLLDLTMPQMDGEETYYELRRIREDVRVILASGYSGQETSRRFHGLGLAGFLAKPFEAATLSAMLREILNPGAA